MREILSAVSGAIFTLAFIPYIRAIWRTRHLPPKTPGKAEPSKTSWIIWVSLDTIALAGMYVERAQNYQILSAVVLGWVVVFLAIKYGTSEWTRFDKINLSGAMLGVALWYVFRNATIAIVISMAVVFTGSFTTFEKAWKHPENEDKLAWFLFWLSCLPMMAAIPEWTLASATQPVTYLVIESIMIYLLFWQPRKPREVVK